MVTKKQRKRERKSLGISFSKVHPQWPHILHKPQTSGSVTPVLVQWASCPTDWVLPRGEHWICSNRESKDSEEVETGHLLKEKGPCWRSRVSTAGWLSSGHWAGPFLVPWALTSCDLSLFLFRSLPSLVPLLHLLSWMVLAHRENPAHEVVTLLKRHTACLCLL